MSSRSEIGSSMSLCKSILEHDQLMAVDRSILTVFERIGPCSRPQRHRTNGNPRPWLFCRGSQCPKRRNPLPKFCRNSCQYRRNCFTFLQPLFVRHWSVRQHNLWRCRYTEVRGRPCHSELSPPRWICRQLPIELAQCYNGRRKWDYNPIGQRNQCTVWLLRFWFCCIACGEICLQQDS
jgi:hypothetical protein